jgi:hypothetical protein
MCKIKTIIVMWKKTIIGKVSSKENNYFTEMGEDNE